MDLTDTVFEDIQESNFEDLMKRFKKKKSNNEVLSTTPDSTNKSCTKKKEEKEKEKEISEKKTPGSKAKSSIKVDSELWDNFKATYYLTKKYCKDLIGDKNLSEAVEFAIRAYMHLLDDNRKNKIGF